MRWHRRRKEGTMSSVAVPRPASNGLTEARAERERAQAALEETKERQVAEAGLSHSLRSIRRTMTENNHVAQAVIDHILGG